MIKELIAELAYDKISLAQALTRAKLIQSKLKSDSFKGWLSNELNGYDDHLNIPEYRILNIELIGNFAGNGGLMENVPLVLQQLDKHIDFDFYEYRETGSISYIEASVAQSKPTVRLFLPLNSNVVHQLDEMYRRKNPAFRLISAGRIVYPGQYKEILDQTKQKFLDVLLELESEFPNLANDYTITEEKKKIIKSIITNNIYGGNNPMNIAVGETVSQSGNTVNITLQDEQTLASLGVEKKQIEELKAIVEETAGDKEGLKSKILKWLAKVSASVVSRGLYDKIPAIIDFVDNLTQTRQ